MMKMTNISSLENDESHDAGTAADLNGGTVEEESEGERERRDMMRKEVERERLQREAR